MMSSVSGVRVITPEPDGLVEFRSDDDPFFSLLLLSRLPLHGSLSFNLERLFLLDSLRASVCSSCAGGAPATAPTPIA